MTVRNVTIDDVLAAEPKIREHVFPPPLIRSYALERELNLPESRRVWIKDYGWTASGSFKLFGALNWMANNLELIGNRPIAAHSSGNFASGIAYAGMRFKKRVIVVMPDTAPKIKFERTRSFGAEIQTYNAARDHETGEREGLARRIAEEENAVQASPYDDPHVIAGNGVGALEVVRDLKREGRVISHFFCPISGGGLMSGQALAIADGFPQAKIIGVEPAGADDFSQSLASGVRTRIPKPSSICDGLLSYSVGEHNWPILQRLVKQVITMPDKDTQQAMRFLYEKHGVRAEPTGAIGIAALLSRQADLSGDGDIVLVLSGRNVDDDAFRKWIAD
ncbi:threonine ammonia-lyase [Zavarzinella formosa]|uniref:threonine ammonia-lyase n=1 Tax=Zavarzinella formosa TaxID=360055 RepID=UPI0002F67211|nr:threonine/serine dehydratase [Zavarzinella formosa]